MILILSDEEKRKRQRAYYKKNRERILAYQKKRNANPKHGAKHKLIMRRYQKKRLATDPKFKAKQYLANERSFSEERVKASLNRLKKSIEKRSHTLDQWFK